MGDEGREDPDRAAILARRQRFIALAISGMSASCGGDDSKPQPCLDVAPMTESSSDDGATGPLTVGTDSSTSGMPMPCLDIGPMTESTTVVDDTSTDTGSDSTTAADETTGDDTTTGG